MDGLLLLSLLVQSIYHNMRLPQAAFILLGSIAASVTAQKSPTARYISCKAKIVREYIQFQNSLTRIQYLSLRVHQNQNILFWRRYRRTRKATYRYGYAFS